MTSVTTYWVRRAGPRKPVTPPLPPATTAGPKSPDHLTGAQVPRAPVRVARALFQAKCMTPPRRPAPTSEPRRLTRLALPLRGPTSPRLDRSTAMPTPVPAPKNVMAHRAVRPRLKTRDAARPINAPAPEFRTTRSSNVSHRALCDGNRSVSEPNLHVRHFSAMTWPRWLRRWRL